MIPFVIGSIVKIKVSVKNVDLNIDSSDVELHLKVWNTDPVTKEQKYVMMEKSDLIIDKTDIYAFVDTSGLAVGELWCLYSMTYPDPKIPLKKLKEMRVIKIEGIKLVEV